MEETVWDPNDYRVLNPSNIDYKTRTFNDAVKHDHIVLESMKNADNDYPFGAVGVGEPLLAPAALQSAWRSTTPAASSSTHIRFRLPRL